MAALETADRQEGDVARAKSSRLKDKIAALREQMAVFKNLAPVLRAAPDEQISLTAPDARSMATSGRARGIVGYNAQIAADAELYLVVAHEVTHVGHDREQLSSMAGRAKAAMGVKALDALAHRGYFKGAEVSAELIGVTPYVPQTLDLRRQCRGAVRQAALHLRTGKRHVSVSCRRSADLALHDGRE